MEVTRRRVTGGTDASVRAGEALAALVNAAVEVAGQTQKVGEMASHVSRQMESVADAAKKNLSATEDMRMSTRRLTDNMTSVSAITEESAAGAEELSASITELAEGAQEAARMSVTLSSQVSQFEPDAIAKGPETVRLRIAA